MGEALYIGSFQSSQWPYEVGIIIAISGMR